MGRPSETLTQDLRAGPRGDGEADFLYRVLASDRPGDGGARFALGEVDVVVLGRADPARVERNLDAGLRTLRLGVTDPWMSGAHARIQRVLGEWVVEDSGSKNGTWVDGRRVERATLADGAVLELGRTFFLFRRAQPAPKGHAVDLDASALAAVPVALRTLAPGFAAELERLVAVARSEVSVIVRGETGTGKELVANAVHALSGRPGAFVPVNCGALPAQLVESELFGHKKGSFTGAAEDRPGLVRAADRGTLFLDEVGELAQPAQATLLRVLQEHEVRPVGATRAVPVDLRVVSATHRDLGALAEGGGFRSDLLARLSGYSIELPPLRARREDLGLVVSAILGALRTRGTRPTLHPESARALLRHAWPLNIRELEKALGAAAALAGEGPIRLEHLPDAVGEALADRASDEREEDAADRGPLSPEDEVRRAELERLLHRHAGNVSAVAREMGKARMQIQRWLKRYGLDPTRFR